jgi:hypothetical protein
MTALEPLKVFCDIPSFAPDHDLPERYLCNQCNQEKYNLTSVEKADIAIFPDFKTMNKLSPSGKEGQIRICADQNAGTSWNTDKEGAKMQFIHCLITNLPAALSMAERSLATR